jgi:2-C-methyl-D-erythritol 2,4-cyclodiphosphate synthase
MDVFMFKVGIGQDSHRFLEEGSSKKCIVGGVYFEDAPGLDADSDGDVVFHSICNAITSITHIPFLGGVCIEMCKNGITDSKLYLEAAASSLKNHQIIHIALTIEGARPKFQKKALQIRESVAKTLSMNVNAVGITFTSGDGLTSFGKGEGLMCFCALTVSFS